MDRRRAIERAPLEEVERQWEQGGYLFHFGKEQGLPSDIDIETRVLDAQQQFGGRAERSVFVVGGAGEDLDVMKPFLMSMAKEGVQVVGVSMPSYGHSSDADKRWRVHEDGTDKVTFEDYCRLIEVVRMHLGSDKHPDGTRPLADKIDIVGHSLGGAIVAEFGTRYQEHINSVHLVAPAGQYAYGSLPGLRLPPKLFTEFLFAHAGERIKQIPAVLAGEKDIPPVVQNLWINSFSKDGGIINSLNDLETKKVEPRFIQRFWEGKAAAQGRLEEHLSTMQDAQTPVTVYAFGADKLFPPDDLKQLEPTGVRVQVLEGLPHYGILDDSDTVARTIRQNISS